MMTSGAAPAAYETTSFFRDSITAMLASTSTSMKFCDLLNIATESTEIFWCVGLSAQFQYVSLTFLRTAGACPKTVAPGSSAPPTAATMAPSALRRAGDYGDGDDYGF